MKAADLMTSDPACLTPSDSAQRAALLMAGKDCGAIPVIESLDSGRVVGVITDRDLAVRGVAKGRGPDTPVRALMTPSPACCPASADVHDIERIMADRQIRRVVIVDDNGACVGVVAQADLARAHNAGVSDREIARVIEKISEPSRGSDRESVVGPAAGRA